MARQNYEEDFSRQCNTGCLDDLLHQLFRNFQRHSAIPVVLRRRTAIADCLYFGEQMASGYCAAGLRRRFIIINTLLASLGAAVLSFPISVLTALFIAKIAPPKVRAVLTTIVELLAAIPSIVYGVFAAGTITGLVKDVGDIFGINTYGGNSMFAVIILLAIMIFPTITSLSVVAISAVDRSLELGSIALGDHRWKPISK